MEGVQSKVLLLTIVCLTAIFVIMNMITNVYIIGNNESILTHKIINTTNVTLTALNKSNDYLLRLFTYYVHQIRENISETRLLIRNQSSLNFQAK